MLQYASYKKRPNSETQISDIFEEVSRSSSILSAGCKYETGTGALATFFSFSLWFHFIACLSLSSGSWLDLAAVKFTFPFLQ